MHAHHCSCVRPAEATVAEERLQDAQDLGTQQLCACKSQSFCHYPDRGTIGSEAATSREQLMLRLDA